MKDEESPKVIEPEVPNASELPFPLSKARPIMMRTTAA
jgi:hypothetical protein